MGKVLGLGLAVFGGVQLAGIAWSGAHGLWRKPRAAAARPALTKEQQPLVSALWRVLDEDGVPEPERWASAIVRAAPTTDLGYLAMVTAQIRRESKFLVPDLEWLFRQLVPELVHDLGVPDPIHTVGPMQVQRWRLQAIFERARGERLRPEEVEAMACDLETGVAACVAVLDRIVVEHVPDRGVRGWVDTVGPAGLLPDRPVTAQEFRSPDPERRRQCLLQKLLSDLTATPLAIDGVPGDATTALLQRSGLADAAAARTAWQRAFAATPPDQLRPRIAHVPEVAFVFADFNAGPGSCRTAALQALLADLLGDDLACDGKNGPLTRDAMRRLFDREVADPARRQQFADLLDRGQKPVWVRDQAWELARQVWRARHGEEAPRALVPDLWFGGAAQQVKGLGRISVAGYVAGSVRFFEDYLRRLVLYTGGEVPGPRV
ncbi:MAG: DUF1615 family protein [Planctomycetota bacterium]